MEKYDLKVTIDPDAGFCFGVTHAIDAAEKSLQNGSPLYSVGALVHNEEELMRLQRQGLVVVDKEKVKDIKNSKILFRAHGEPPEIYDIVREGNNELIDATCPIVQNIQRNIKKAYDDGENIFIYGQVGHPEIIGIKGQIKGDAVVFNNIEELKAYSLPKKLTLYCQTTKSQEDANAVKNYLENCGVKVNSGNKVCSQVANRKLSLEEFCRHHDKVIFIAGENSANGQSLYKASKVINPQTYFVSSLEDVKKLSFDRGESVGVSGATSTPLWLIHQVAQFLGYTE